MKLIHYELNIVTMTAIILAVGLLVDDAIVVIENIARHVSSGGKSLFQASVDGTKEIFLADFCRYCNHADGIGADYVCGWIFTENTSAVGGGAVSGPFWRHM